MADYILSGFPAVLRKAQWVGNPVRESIVQLPTPGLRFATHRDPLQLLVLGGSLGAQALNEVVPLALKLVPEERRPQVTHQSGAKHLDALRRELSAKQALAPRQSPSSTTSPRSTLGLIS